MKTVTVTKHSTDRYNIDTYKKQQPGSAKDDYKMQCRDTHMIFILQVD